MNVFIAYILCFLLAIIILVSIYKYIQLSKKESFQLLPTDPILIQIERDLIKVHPELARFEYRINPTESYTENKQVIFMCLKDENQEYYDYNFLIYVALHEASHALSKTVDTNHEGEEFNSRFQDLLLRAEILGIYDPSKKPTMDMYCGVKVN